MDISNGEGVGCSLFVSGCHFHCKNCFNKETWDFNYGSEWNDEAKNKFLKIVSAPHIKRVSFLGGSPLCDENVCEVYHIIKEISESFPDKKIWVYTGYTYEHIVSHQQCGSMEDSLRAEILSLIDVLVDGPYVDELRDLRLKFKGSLNQRVIDVQNTLQKGDIVLWSRQ